MAYFSNGVLRRGRAKVLKTSAAETSSTTHDLIATKHYGVVSIAVDVTAASGTSPTLVVVAEGSFDGGTTWHELGRIGNDGYRVGSVGSAPTSITGVTAKRGVFSAAPLVRSRSIIGGGTPSFTYSVLAELG